MFDRTLAVEVTIDQRLTSVNRADLELLGTAVLTWNRENFLTDLAVAARAARNPRHVAVMDHGWSDLNPSYLSYTILAELTPAEDATAVRSQLDEAVSGTRISARMTGSFLGSPTVFSRNIFQVSVDHYENNPNVRNRGYVGLDWPQEI